MLPEEEQVFLLRAVALSEEAVNAGNHPFGCVIVERRKMKSAEGVGEEEGTFVRRVVVESQNTVHTCMDPTGHAELNAVRTLGSLIGEKKEGGSDQDSLHDGFELFTSTEPCIMCCGAIYWSFSIDRVVFACPESGLARHAGEDFLASSRETLAKGNRPIRVEGPFFQEQAERLHAEYWPKLFAKDQ